MPELPEVETLRRGLEHHLSRRRIVDVEIIGPRTVRRHASEEVPKLLVGNTVSKCGRHGKYLIVFLDSGIRMVIHLRMTGRLEIVTPPFLGDIKHLHARFRLDDDRELLFFDPRTFGEIFISTTKDADQLPDELASLGPDPLSDNFTLDHLVRVCKKRNAAIKSLLLDQNMIAGIGNIYGDEICYEAGVLPTKRASQLTDGELAKLYKATGQILLKAVERKGSTLSDKKYLDITGSEGQYQKHHRVYAKVGTPCTCCGNLILRVKISGRSSYYCPYCQK